MLEARSIAEIHLYMKIAGCDRCGKARQFDAAALQTATVPGSVTVHAHCPACGTAVDLVFRVKDSNEPAPVGYPQTINSTQKCSRLIDLGQWITLAHLLVEEARGAKAKDRMRFLNLQAGLCYDEALKFYDDPDNELPPVESFFTDASRTRFRSSPQQFARSRLIGERAKLPNVRS
jgi:endogenous inhibitor of DNA gyrase (YacG/DUF329 family)